MSYSYYYMRFPEGKTKALTLSYDDGVEQDAQLIRLMEQYGFKGTFNLNAGLFAPEGTVYAPGRVHRRFPLSKIKEVYSSDCIEVACHGYEHLRLERMQGADAIREVVRDRRALESLFGRMITGMAYAYGTFNDQSVEILKHAGIHYARTAVSTEKFSIPTDWLRMPATCRHFNPRLMELAEKFKNLEVTSYPKFFCLFGHSYEFEQDDNWDLIEGFFEKMQNLPDVWYATNLEICDYVKAYEQLQFGMGNQIVHNPTMTDIWISQREEEAICIPAGKTVSLLRGDS